MSGYDIWTIRLELSLLSLSENTIAGNFDYFIEVETTDMAGQSGWEMRFFSRIN